MSPIAGGGGVPVGIKRILCAFCRCANSISNLPSVMSTAIIVSRAKVVAINIILVIADFNMMNST